MMSLRLLALLLAPLLALGQISRIGLSPNRHHIPSDGLVVLYGMGPDGERNSLDTWMNGARNLLISSADLTGWGTIETPVVATTTVEDNNGGQYEAIFQIVAAPANVTYTQTFRVLKDAVVPATRYPMFRMLVDDSYEVRLDTSSGATTQRDALSGSHVVTSDGDYWRLVCSFLTDDANGILIQIFPARGANADLTTASLAAVGTITILRQQLTPGTSSGEYEATTDRQSVYNWALTDRRNLLEYSGDLTEWDASGTPVVTTFTLEDNSTGGYESILQTVSAPDNRAHTWTLRVLKDAVVPATRFASFRVTVDGDYHVNLDTSSGATTESGGLSGANTVTSDGNYWKVVISFTTNDGDGIVLKCLPARGANANLTTASVAAQGTITIASQQLERGLTATHYQHKDASNVGWLDATVGSDTDAGGDANDPSDALIDPGDPTIVAARGGFDGVDDYNAVSSVPLNDNFSVLALVKEASISSWVSILRSTSPAWPAARSFFLTSNTGSGRFAIKTSTSGEVYATVGSLTTGAWHFLAGTYNGAAVIGYLDGVAGTPTAVTGAMSGSKDFTISSATNPWEGTIPFLAVYDRALEPDEIHRIYMNVAHRYCTYRGILCDVLGINPWHHSFAADFGV